MKVGGREGQRREEEKVGELRKKLENPSQK
jgi:hypothetical protein